jgi:hypothetical protein
VTHNSTHAATNEWKGGISVSQERLARVVTGAFWVCYTLWGLALIARLTGLWHVPWGALAAGLIFMWAALRCPRCALPVFYRPSGAPGVFKIRYFLTQPDRACPRCGLRFKKKKRY